MNFLNPIIAGIVGPWQLIVILVIALLIFGKRLPEIAQGLGKSLTAFKKGLNEIEDDIDKAGKQDTSKQMDSSQNDSDSADENNTPI